MRRNSVPRSTCMWLDWLRGIGYMPLPTTLTATGANEKRIIDFRMFSVVSNWICGVCVVEVEIATDESGTIEEAGASGSLKITT